MRYISWVVALLESCDVTKHGRHLRCHLGFSQELEVKPAPNISGFIAQLVRASHQYREVTGSNPVSYTHLTLPTNREV